MYWGLGFDSLSFGSDDDDDDDDAFTFSLFCFICSKNNVTGILWSTLLVNNHFIFCQFKTVDKLLFM